MNTRSAARISRWSALYRRLLPAYWIFLTAMTHLPKPDVPRAVNNDRFLHVLAFGVLTFLYWKVRESLATPISLASIGLALIALMGYAALDEYLQGFTGRTTDFLDWVADCIGIIGVLVLLEVWRRVMQPHAKPSRL